MNRFAYFLSLTAIVSLSCNLVTGLSREPALVEVTGPILGMTVAASLDDQGQPVEPSFTYPADQPEMVVVVWIGEVAPGALTFSWYRVTEAGDEALFEQTVAVEARDAAFSTGLNPGILAAGTYKVVATFAGGSETIAWDVADTQPGDLTAPVGTSGSAAGAAPAPGPSGRTPTVVPSSGPGSVSGPALFPNIRYFSIAPEVKFDVSSMWPDAQGHGIPSPISFTIEVNAFITGGVPVPGSSRQHTHAAGSIGVVHHYRLNPCALDGESDLPGTSITVSATTPGYGANRQTDTAVLGADTSGPKVTFGQITDPTQKVKEGDQIELNVTAEEVRSGGSWQKGIREMQMTGPVYAPSGAWTNPSPLPKACEEKTWSHTATFTYTVPPNPPAEIKLCVLAEDYAGNFNPTAACITYHTGDQLKGKLTRTITTFWSDPTTYYIATSLQQLDADLSLNLQADGTVSGTAQINYAIHDEVNGDCGTWGHELIDPMQFSAPLTGQWTRDSIDFRFTPDAPIMVDVPIYAIGCDVGLAGPAHLDLRDRLGMNMNNDPFHATWDGQAYAADVNIPIVFDDGGTSEDHWTIHLEPPAPDVGLGPGPWTAASGVQASVDLSYP
jgi:hypothetical protein